MIIIWKGISNSKFLFNEKIQEYVYIDELSAEQLSLLGKIIIVGVDAGKFNLVYMVDETGKKLRCTAHQTRHDSKSLENHKILMH